MNVPGNSDTGNQQTKFQKVITLLAEQYIMISELVHGLLKFFNDLNRCLQIVGRNVLIW